MTESNSTQASSVTETKISNAAHYSNNREKVRAHQKAKRAVANNPPLTEGAKRCTKCAKDKPRTKFHAGKEYPDGRKAVCKDCMQAQRRAKYASQRDAEVSKRQTRKDTSAWQALKPEREKQAAARLAKRIENGVPAERCCTGCAKILPSSLAYFNRAKYGSFGLSAKCVECLSIASDARRNANRERYREMARQSYARNSERRLAEQKVKRRTDPGFALHMRISSAVRQSLNKSRLGTSWLSLLTYSPSEMKRHLESLFTEGMTWDRFLAGEIHVDHIIPVSFFNPRHPESLEFRMCWSLNNLQPLWAVDNLRKSDTLPPNFTELWNLLYNEATRYAA